MYTHCATRGIMATDDKGSSKGKMKVQNFQSTAVEGGAIMTFTAMEETYELTLDALLKLPELKPLRVLSCRGSLNRPVTDVTVMDTPYIGNWVRGGELVLCSGYFLSSRPSDIVDLIETLAQKGVAAIGIKLHHWIDDLSEEALRVSEAHGLPIIEIPADWAWVKVIDCVHKAIIRRDAQLQDLAQSFKERLFQCIKRGVKRQEVLRELAIEIERLAVLCNSAFDEILLAVGPEGDLPNLTTEDIKAIGAAISSGQGTMIDVNAQTLSKNWSGLSVSAGATQFNSLVVPVATSFTTLFLIVLEPVSMDLPAQHIVLASETADIIALGLEHETANLAEEKRDSFLFQLLCGEKKDPSEVEIAIRYYGWKLRMPCVAFVSEVQSGTTANSPLLVKNCILNEAPTAVIGQKDNLFFGLIPVTNAEPDQAIQLLRRAHARIKRQAESITYSAGIGNPAKALEEIARSFSEASQALTISRWFRGPNNVASIRQVAPYRLLWDIRSLPEVKQATHMLSPLAEDPRDLLGTLKVYLDCGCKVKATANALHYHRNTVRSHLRAIRELTGLDPQQPKDRFLLELLVNLYELSENMSATPR